MRFLRLFAAIGLVIAAPVAIVPSIPAAILSQVGAILIFNDPIGPADLLALPFESGISGQIEIADLYRQGLAKSVLILEPTPTSIDEELDRRGVRFPDLTVDTIEQLGVPRAAIMKTDGGEGGTTESTQALADWVRRYQIRRMIVVVSPTHGRRYRRALRRVWPSEMPAPIVRTTRYTTFRPDNWWRSRRELRESLVELQKLVLDYMAHPL